MAAKSIMVVGTMSSAGKSLITAGLCRIFKQDGYAVAPFKSQNMALNSYITKDGLEMGRAQVMQAEAAGIEPSVLMNPILLKPTSDKGSQVILNGEVWGNMSAMEYYKHKKEFIPHIMEAYGKLSENNDIIVLEGAGSPSEINLKSVDIVNMGMAKLSKSPVIIVGDIDRGGVFASLYGTVELMEPDERSMIKGIVINKFRGDVKILQSGLNMIEKLTGVPVLGVVPYLNIDIDDEDSLSEKLTKAKTAKIVDIAVIRLPRISNFTDFNVFGLFDGVSLRYVTKPSELGNPDLIIIPGTKNTALDLLWMRQNGLEALILKQNQKGTIIFGVCGGFQMLGKRISDPYCVENGKDIDGMGLLDVSTVFEKNKTRTRIAGKIAKIGGLFQTLSDMDVSGYEIHMGITSNLGNAYPFTVLEGMREDGYTNKGNTVFGSYLHGFFDSENVACKIVEALMKKNGIDFFDMPSFDLKEYKNKQYDMLADEMRKCLNIKKIYEIMQTGLA
ncbi:MAG: cobyric acid synthase [Clostridia bacterium]|nr:cobyric acid synthase [Clostridia bacterium]